MKKHFLLSAFILAAFQVRATELKVNANGLYDAAEYEQEIRANDAQMKAMNADDDSASLTENMERGGGGHGGGGHGGGGGWPGGGHGGGGWHGGPGYPVPIPVPVPGPRWVTCFAENARGQEFSGTAHYPQAAQDRAMNNCQAVSAVCHATGCQ